MRSHAAKDRTCNANRLSLEPTLALPVALEAGKCRMQALSNAQPFPLDVADTAKLDSAGRSVVQVLLISSRALPPLALLTLWGWLNAVILQHYWPSKACNLCLMELWYLMAAWCGVCLSNSDPGYVPPQAQPLEAYEGSFCTVCNSFKPYRWVSS
jgi:hypothetical protein